jgi:hypothetical protein
MLEQPEAKGRIDEGAFTGLVSRIVADVFPEEQAAYTVAAPILLPRVFGGENIIAQDQAAKGEFQFVEEAKSILQLVGLINSTYLVVRGALSSLSRSNELQPSPLALVNEWKRTLISMGVEEQRADAIVSRYLSELQSVIYQSNGTGK